MDNYRWPLIPPVQTQSLVVLSPSVNRRKSIKRRQYVIIAGGFLSWFYQFKRGWCSTVGFVSLSRILISIHSLGVITYHLRVFCLFCGEWQRDVRLKVHTHLGRERVARVGVDEVYGSGIRGGRRTEGNLNYVVTCNWTSLTSPFSRVGMDHSVVLDINLSLIWNLTHSCSGKVELNRQRLPKAVGHLYSSIFHSTPSWHRHKYSWGMLSLGMDMVAD